MLNKFTEWWLELLLGLGIASLFIQWLFGQRVVLAFFTTWSWPKVWVFHVVVLIALIALRHRSERH